MRREIILALCFVFLLSAFASTATASESPVTWDSLNIPEEETVDFVKEHDGDVIVKLYGLEVFYAIRNDPEKSIREHLDSPNAQSPRLISVSAENLEQEGDLSTLLQALFNPIPLFEALENVNRDLVMMHSGQLRRPAPPTKTKPKNRER